MTRLSCPRCGFELVHAGRRGQTCPVCRAARLCDETGSTVESADSDNRPPSPRTEHPSTTVVSTPGHDAISEPPSPGAHAEAVGRRGRPASQASSAQCLLCGRVISMAWLASTCAVCGSVVHSACAKQKPGDLSRDSACRGCGYVPADLHVVQETAGTFNYRVAMTGHAILLLIVVPCFSAYHSLLPPPGGVVGYIELSLGLAVSWLVTALLTPWALNTFCWGVSHSVRKIFLVGGVCWLTLAAAFIGLAWLVH